MYNINVREYYIMCIVQYELYFTVTPESCFVLSTNLDSFHNERVAVNFVKPNLHSMGESIVFVEYLLYFSLWRVQWIMYNINYINMQSILNIVSYISCKRYKMIPSHLSHGQFSGSVI